MIIIGVDPGKTTGVSVYQASLGGGAVLSQSVAIVAVKYIWTVIESSPVVVCCERYDITPGTAQKSRQYDALKVTGALEYKCLLHGAKFMQYSRADAKRFATDKKLEEMRMYDKHLTHGTDAARQVVMYLAETNQLPKLSVG